MLRKYSSREARLSDVLIHRKRDAPCRREHPLWAEALHSGSVSEPKYTNGSAKVLKNLGSHNEF